MKKIRIPALLVALSLSPLHPVLAQAAQDACGGAKANVTIDQVKVDGDVIKANGTWAVTGAAGALVEVRIDADRWQSESFKGAKGTWTFDQKMKWQKCGHYSVRVWAYPSVDAKGRLYNCLEKDTSTPWRFDIPCSAKSAISHCDWECGEGDGNLCVGTCVGTAAGGVTPYTAAYWGVDDANYQETAGASEGPWTGVVQCAPGQKVSFKVREQTGKLTRPAQLACGAQPDAP
jgi:hypothetical protein